MADFYYLYDPADNLALGQAIHLANTDGGMSYIVPFANKSGHVDATDPASAGLGVIETAIAAGPLHPGGSSDPISNRLTPTQFQGLVSSDQWTAIKAMVKASLQQAPPAGWSEASMEAAGTTYSVISADGYSKLRTDVFTGGAWKDADTSDKAAQLRGNPFIAFGGVVTAQAFIDYSGHFIPTATQIGNETISPTGVNNAGSIYKVPEGYFQVGDDDGSPVYGLTIDAGADNVTLVNFSATSQGLGRRKTAFDDLGFTTSGGAKALGIALYVHSGNLSLGGDFVIDQFTQVVDGTVPKPAAFQISGASSHVTFDKARLYLGSVRGYESIIGVDRSASLVIKDSTIYGFSSSNSNAPLIPGQGLDWAGFSQADTGSAAIDHLISAESGGSLTLNGSTLLREDYWQATGAYATTATNMGKNVNWTDNDYKDISSGDLNVGGQGKLEIINSKILGTITTQNNSNSLHLKDSVVGGSAVGTLFGGSMVQLNGGVTTIENSLVDSLDSRILDFGSFCLSKDTHVLASATPWKVATTSDPAYSALASFAGPSSLQTLQAWADKENAATGNKAVFQFQGPQATVATPSGKSQLLEVLVTEAGPAQILGSGAIRYALMASFQQPVSGFDLTDLQAAIGTVGQAAGWQVPAPPVSRDGGKTWSFSIQSPVSHDTSLTLQLAAGAASSTLISGLTSEASNPFNLQPVASGAGGGVGFVSRPVEVVEPVAVGGIGYATVELLRSGDTSGSSSVQVTFDGGTATGAPVAPAEGASKGPSSSATPYVLPVVGSGVATRSILTTGDVVGGYTMAGIPDGLGAFDNNDGTFTVLMNHEIGSTSGAVRSHGGKGAFISSWIISKSDLTVKSGKDLITNVFGWNSSTQSSNSSPNNSANSNGFSFNRFCSADLAQPSAFFNPTSGLGTPARLFLNGEEGGSNGFALANVASGPNAGSTFILGKFNLYTNGSGQTGVGGWENLLANPKPQDKTIVIGNNDGGTGIMTGSIVVYQGTKTATGTDADKAGLTNGAIKFVTVNGVTSEISDPTTRATAISNGSRFALSSSASTTFSRPEDGSWDPLNPNRYYFVTTDRLDNVSDGLGTQVGQTRLWRLTFDDITNPDLGGTIELLVDGDIVNGKKVNMFDNITIDKYGHILLQEDVGNAAHNGKIWQYETATDSLKLLTQFDPARFGDISTPATSPFTIDEESSGVIDVQDILGAGWFLLDAQAHYPIADPKQVEDGQLLALFNPDTYVKGVDYINAPQTVVFGPGETVKSISIPILGDAKPEYQESINLKLSPAVGSSTPVGASVTQVLINDMTVLQGPINFKYLTGEGGTVELGIDYLQGRLYGTDLLPKSGDFRLSPASGGFSAEMPVYSTSKDYIRLTYVPGAASQAVVQSEKVLNDLGVFETIASAGRGLLPSVVHNYVHSGVGDDRITGSAGIDFIRAGAGDDWVDAGAGDDIVRPGSGNDQVRLGAGADALLMTRDQQLGICTLLDFSPEDRLVLADGLKVLSGIGTASLKVGDGSGSFKELILTGASLSSWDQKMIQLA